MRTWIYQGCYLTTAPDHHDDRLGWSPSVKLNARKLRRLRDREPSGLGEMPVGYVAAGTFFGFVL